MDEHRNTASASWLTLLGGLARKSQIHLSAIVIIFFAVDLHMITLYSPTLYKKKRADAAHPLNAPC